MKIHRWQCWLKQIWRRIAWSIPVEGHNYVDQEVHKNVTAIVSKCEVCGKIEVGWTDDPDVESQL